MTPIRLSKKSLCRMQALTGTAAPGSQIIQKFTSDPKKVLENARRGNMEDLIELANFWDSVRHQANPPLDAELP